MLSVAGRTARLWTVPCNAVPCSPLRRLCAAHLCVGREVQRVLLDVVLELRERERTVHLQEEGRHRRDETVQVDKDRGCIISLVPSTCRQAG